MIDINVVRSKVMYIASSNMYMETDKFITAMGGNPGDEWCAIFAGYCYKRAFDIEGFALPFALSKGAKALTRNVGNARARGIVGQLFTDGTQALPGDILCWHRKTGPVSWKGHCGIVKSVDTGMITTFEGNTGSPAGVHVLCHDLTKEDRFWSFAGLR